MLHLPLYKTSQSNFSIKCPGVKSCRIKMYIYWILCELQMLSTLSLFYYYMSDFLFYTNMSPVLRILHVLNISFFLLMGIFSYELLLVSTHTHRLLIVNESLCGDTAACDMELLYSTGLYCNDHFNIKCKHISFLTSPESSPSVLSQFPSSSLISDFMSISWLTLRCRECWECWE